MADSKSKKKHNFVCVDAEMFHKGGSFSFNSYTDTAGVFGNPGAAIAYFTGDQVRGKDVGKYFALNQSNYNLQAYDGQKDYKGLALYDFLKNSPYCEGSPNGSYEKDETTGEMVQRGVKFKLLDSAKDAKFALQAAKQKTEAQASVMSLDDTTLTEVAAIFGIYGEPDDEMRFNMYSTAGNKPRDYFAALNNGDRPVRAIVRKAIADKIFTEKGKIIYWEKTVVGHDEDAAVATLLADKEMLEGLQERFNLKVPGKVGRPPKNKE